MPAKKINLPGKINLQQFISTRAHDMRTPFNHIIGFSKVILNTAGETLSDLQKEDLGTVYRSGLRALTITNGLIDIARLNRGEKGITRSPVDLEEVLAQALAHWKKFHPGTDTRVETRLLVSSKSLPADEHLLQQVISGFIACVAEYCENGADVTVTVEEDRRWFRFTFVSSGSKAHTPSGFDLEMLGGIGRAFVELHRGRVLKAEENDAGATICFILPKR